MGNLVTADRSWIEATSKAFVTAATARGMLVTEDMRVAGDDMAALLGMSAKSFSNLRRDGIGPPHFWLSVGGSKVSYRIVDVVLWLETQRRVPKPPQTSPKTLTSECVDSETVSHEDTL